MAQKKHLNPLILFHAKVPRTACATAKLTWSGKFLSASSSSCNSRYSSARRFSRLRIFAYNSFKRPSWPAFSPSASSFEAFNAARWLVCYCANPRRTSSRSAWIFYYHSAYLSYL